jgi:hypothetical protein
VRESGYDGRPIVVIHVTDRVHMNAAALVTRQRLDSIGFNVILKPMDWSTNLAVRARKEPPDKGGWNVLHTWFMGADVISPAVHFAVSGAGPAAWFGWPDIPRVERLTTDWVRTTDQTKRKQIADEIQKVALSEVAYVPWENSCSAVAPDAASNMAVRTATGGACMTGAQVGFPGGAAGWRHLRAVGWGHEDRPRWPAPHGRHAGPRPGKPAVSRLLGVFRSGPAHSPRVSRARGRASRPLGRASRMGTGEETRPMYDVS